MTELGSLAALGEVSLEPYECLHLAAADIQDCFYAAYLPPGMSSFFCLKNDLTVVEAKFVSGDNWEVDDNIRISPCISILRMGFSWSFLSHSMSS